MKKIESILPKQIDNLTKIDLQNAVATIITNPNEYKIALLQPNNSNQKG